MDATAEDEGSSSGLAASGNSPGGWLHLLRGKVPEPADGSWEEEEESYAREPAVEAEEEPLEKVADDDPALVGAVAGAEEEEEGYTEEAAVAEAEEDDEEEEEEQEGGEEEGYAEEAAVEESDQEEEEGYAEEAVPEAEEGLEEEGDQKLPPPWRVKQDWSMSDPQLAETNHEIAVRLAHPVSSLDEFRELWNYAAAKAGLASGDGDGRSAGAPAVGECVFLLQRADLDDDCVEYMVAWALTHSIYPSKIRLDHNRLTGRSMTALGALFDRSLAVPPERHVLKELHISHNEIDDEGAVHLFECMRKCGWYPWDVGGEQLAPLWCRMEKNPLYRLPDVIAGFRGRICKVSKPCRPKTCRCSKSGNCFLQLPFAEDEWCWGDRALKRDTKAREASRKGGRDKFASKTKASKHEKGKKAKGIVPKASWKERLKAGKESKSSKHGKQGARGKRAVKDAPWRARSPTGGVGAKLPPPPPPPPELHELRDEGRAKASRREERTRSRREGGDGAGSRSRSRSPLRRRDIGRGRPAAASADGEGRSNAVRPRTPPRGPRKAARTEGSSAADGHEGAQPVVVPPRAAQRGKEAESTEERLSRLPAPPAMPPPQALLRGSSWPPEGGGGPGARLPTPPSMPPPAALLRQGGAEGAAATAGTPVRGGGVVVVPPRPQRPPAAPVPPRPVVVEVAPAPKQIPGKVRPAFAPTSWAAACGGGGSEPSAGPPRTVLPRPKVVLPKPKPRPATLPPPPLLVTPPAPQDPRRLQASGAPALAVRLRVKAAAPPKRMPAR